jgi:hypothetical protein
MHMSSISGERRHVNSSADLAPACFLCTLLHAADTAVGFTKESSSEGRLLFETHSRISCMESREGTKQAGVSIAPDAAPQTCWQGPG